MFNEEEQSNKNSVCDGKAYSMNDKSPIFLNDGTFNERFKINTIELLQGGKIEKDDE